MSGLRGNPQHLRDFAKRINVLPKTVQHRVAAAGSTALTKRLRGSFEAGRTVYDTARPAGVDGNAMSLVKSGATKASLYFVAIGRRLRARLGTRWARYLIRFGILPRGGAAMPASWRRELGEAAREEIARGLKG